MSIDKNRNENIVCRRLLNKVLLNNGNDNINSLEYNQTPNVKINIIASDGNYQYHNIIKCKKRITVKAYKDKKNKKLLRDNNCNIIGDIKKEYYNYNNNDNNIDYLDCNKHIIDKAENKVGK